MTFNFSISDLGTFLGKSPVTLRAWERKGLVKLPRKGVNRSLTVEDLYEVAYVALDAGRISEERWRLLLDAVMTFREIEAANQ